MSCSQNRTTTQPLLLSPLEIARSRFRLFIIFGNQYVLFVFGLLEHKGHPCQKQPSTNIAALNAGKAKSGLPSTPRGHTFHPLTPIRTKSALTLASVDLFPRDLMALIMRERPSEGGCSFLLLAILRPRAT